MNSEFAKQAEQFRKRQLATVGLVANSMVAQPTQSSSITKQEPGSEPPSKKAPVRLADLDKLKGSKPRGNEQKISMLTKIIKYMRERHLQRSFHPLAFQEILEEAGSPVMSNSVREWLMKEALPENPKLERDPLTGKYVFKPKYALKDRKDLLQLLIKHEKQGLGCVKTDDVMESLPDAKAIIVSLGETVFKFSGPDKKEVLFFNNSEYVKPIDEVFKETWREINLDSIDEKKVQEHLEKTGFSSFQITERNRNPFAKPKRGRARGTLPPKRRDNTHLASDLLQDFSSQVETNLKK